LVLRCPTRRVTPPSVSQVLPERAVAEVLTLVVQTVAVNVIDNRARGCVQQEAVKVDRPSVHVCGRVEVLPSTSDRQLLRDNDVIVVVVKENAVLPYHD